MQDFLVFSYDAENNYFCSESLQAFPAKTTNACDYKIIRVDETFYTIVDEHRYNYYYSYLSFVIFFIQKIKSFFS